MPQKRPKGGDGAPSGGITDARFANFQTDPRFRLPSKRQHKVTVDKRFSRMLTDDDFTVTAKVDRYGRKLRSGDKKKVLQRLYRQEDEPEPDDDSRADDDGGGGDDDKLVRRELRRADEKYDPARDGGLSSSESDEESAEESEEEEADPDEDGEGEVAATADMQRFRNEQGDVPVGEVTNRVAVVNLDWDHIKSADLLAMFTSFVPKGGSIEKIAIYPSEFGKERMRREELEGPPKEIFKHRAADEEGEDEEDLGSGGDSADDAGSGSDEGDDEIDDEQVKKDLLQEGDDQDFDSEALRSYQLDRLRYYYAVMTCSDKRTAEAVYEATDGKEFQSSSNFIDLRFVPDDVAFDDEPRDECDAVPAGYRPVEFVTDALQHSKVKLTWDMHPEEAARKDSIKRAFTGSRDGIAENDLQAYLASDSDEDDGAATDQSAVDDEPVLSKKEIARKKMREALGLGSEPAPKS